jgi:hypothetical protein
VPHVRTSVHGTKKTGRSPSNALAMRAKRLMVKRRNLVTHGVKAFEKIVIGPCTLARTWGTRLAWSGSEIGYAPAQI